MATFRMWGLALVAAAFIVFGGITASEGDLATAALLLAAGFTTIWALNKVRAGES